MAWRNLVKKGKAPPQDMVDILNHPGSRGEFFLHHDWDFAGLFGSTIFGWIGPSGGGRKGKDLLWVFMVRV